MSGTPKSIHARRRYHHARARRAADAANMAMGRLWREVGALHNAWSEPSPSRVHPDRLEALMAEVAKEWRERVNGGWNGIWPPPEFDTVKRVEEGK